MRRNVAGQTVSAQLVNKTDGSNVTTGTTTVYVTGDAGTQATGLVGSGAATHEGNGLWSYAPAQAETNYANVCFTFVNTSAVTANIQIYTLAYDSSGQMTGTTVTTNNDKTGYSLSQAFPTNFSSLAITGGGAVTAGTVSDKTGYSLTQTFPTNFSAMAITAGGALTVGTNNDKTGYTVSTVSDKTGYSLTAGTGLGNQTANITGNLSGSVGSVTGAVGSVTGNVGGNVVGSVASVTAGVTIATGGVGSGDIDSTALNEIADAVLDRVLSAGSDSGGDNTTARTVRQALRTLRNRVNNAAGTLTVYKEDDTTASWTAATTQTAGDPISQINPT